MVTSNKSDNWYVYSLRCKAKYIYTGVTNDSDKRMKAHSEGRGNKYVRGHPPFEVVKNMSATAARILSDFKAGLLDKEGFRYKEPLVSIE